MVVVANPRQFKIPDWFLNRQKDYKDGKFSQVTSNALDMKLRDDLERLKKIRCVIKPYAFATNIFTPFFLYIDYFCCWQESPWFASLLGPPCSRSAHKDHWSQGKDCWCLQEEINRLHANSFIIRNLDTCKKFVRVFLYCLHLNFLVPPFGDL